MFDDRLKSVRMKSGLTQQQVADDLGIPYTTYRNYEYNLREPPIQIAIDICNYFHISLNYLCGFEEGEIPPVQVQHDAITKQIINQLSEFSDKEKRKVKDYCDYINYLRNKAD